MCISIARENIFIRRTTWTGAYIGVNTETSRKSIPRLLHELFIFIGNHYHDVTDLYFLISKQILLLFI